MTDKKTIYDTYNAELFQIDAILGERNDSRKHY